jgi:hypothetical protein
MPKLEHVTVTSPDIDPSTIMDKFLRGTNKAVEFVPVISLDGAEKKRRKEILEYQERLTKYSENRELYLKSLERLNSQSTKDFAKSFYGFTDFDLKTKFFGYFGNSNNRLDSYEMGEEVFPIKSGEVTNQARKVDIDWIKMGEKAHEAAVWNAEQDRKNVIYRDAFISRREKVHMRPSSFIDKDGTWYQPDEMDDDLKKSLVLYQKAWEKALLEADPEDIITHWHVKD